MIEIVCWYMDRNHKHVPYDNQPSQSECLVTHQNTPKHRIGSIFWLEHSGWRHVAGVSQIELWNQMSVSITLNMGRKNQHHWFHQKVIAELVIPGRKHKTSLIPHALTFGSLGSWDLHSWDAKGTASRVQGFVVVERSNVPLAWPSHGFHEHIIRLSRSCSGRFFNACRM